MRQTGLAEADIVLSVCLHPLFLSVLLAATGTGAALTLARGVVASLTVTWSILRPIHKSAVLRGLTVPTSLSS